MAKRLIGVARNLRARHNVWGCIYGHNPDLNYGHSYDQGLAC